MRTQPFSNADIGRVVEKLKTAPVWKGIRAGARVWISHARTAPLGRCVQWVLYRDRTRLIGHEATVAEAVSMLNQEIEKLRYARRQKEEAPV